MSVERVRAHLRERDWEGEILEFGDSTATVALAAEQAGTTPERIAKTIALYGVDDGTAVLIVAAGDAKVNGGKFKRAFGMKPRMLRGDDVERLTSFRPGGVCPFATPGSATVYLDASLQRFSTVFPAAGTANSAVEISLDALPHLSDSAGWVDVTAGWEPPAAS